MYIIYIFKKPIMQDINTEPSEAQITLLVNNFYARVRIDPLLAPVFESKVSDWAAHQKKMTGFWRSVLLGTKEYRGHLIAIHQRLPGIQPEHFTCWLELFDQTMRDTLEPAARPYTQYIAQRFSRALQLGLFGNAGRQRQTAPVFVNPLPSRREVLPC